MLCCDSLWFDEEEFAFFNFGLRWNKSVYVLASSGRVDKYSSCAPCTDLSPRLYRHYSNFPDPDLHSCGTGDPSVAPLGKWHFIPSPLTFICQAAIFVLKLWQSEWHAAPSAPAVPTQAGALSGHSPPRASHAVSQASPPPLPPMCVFVSQGQGTKCWVIPIKLSGWKRLQMLLFLSLVLSPQSLLFSLPWILSALAARVLGVCVFKKLKKRGLWKRSWGLGFCNLWIAVFLNCLWLNSQKYKVNRLKQMDSFLVAPGYLLTTETLLFVLFTINSNIY